MIIDPDGVPAILLIENLLRVKLSSENRSFVLDCKTKMQQNGDVPFVVKSRLRKIYKSKRVQLKEMFEAHERALQNMARERMGLSEVDIKNARNERLSALRDKHNDLGF